MHWLVAALIGLVVGFVGSVPVAGPISVLVLQRAVDGKRKSALLTGVGGAVGEAIYATGVGVALPVLHNQVQAAVPITRAVGAVVITVVGLVLSFRSDILKERAPKKDSGDVLTGLAASLFNPTIIATWTVVIGSVYADGWLPRKPILGVPLGVGVLLGVTAWYAIVVAAADRVKRLLGRSRRRKLIRGIGVVLVGVGLYLGVRVFTAR